MAKKKAKAKAEQGPQFRDRIKDVRKVHASELRPHPKNWRTHPEGQRTALKAVLDEVGIVDTLIAYEHRGKLVLIDGHLRQEELDQEVTVVVTDLTAAEAEKVLLTHDPLAAMAGADQELLGSLLERVQTDDDDLGQLLRDLGESNGIGVDIKTQNQYTGKIDSPIYEPKGEQPKISDLTDRTKTTKLLKNIKQADIPGPVKAFLNAAAARHTVYDFRAIAEYYCHAEPEIQKLMEESGLVIIDFDQAVEQGFVKLSEKMKELAQFEESQHDA